ncbi:MAG TPA: hypothetical protein VHX36_14925 [Candidatus Acidoferrales bacterium]|nr:hypothetical protein [Candidatus Acidoferrales bacterium]
MSKHRQASQRPSAGARRSSEAGFAYVLALGIILAVIIGSQVVLQNLVTQGRRQREQETIWRGNQWARAIRLYYHKTGHYPQTIDDLETGVPELHFLRAAAIKDPMEPDDGSWRFIYVNGTGQIIGSVRYATLQQMALLDLNNGQIPGMGTQSLLPGAVSAASLSSMSPNGGSGGIFSSSDNSTSSAGTGAANGSQAPGGSASVGGTSGQNPQGTAPPDTGSSQSQSGSSDNSAAPGGQQTSGSTETPSFGQGQSAGAFGSTGSTALGQSGNPLAQVMALQPTGPVDGPVVGAFLTGVGIPTAIDQKSIRIYHGGKKYKDWEFIWNPLEDQAQALQQGLGAQSQGAQPGQTQPGATPSSGTSPFGTTPPSSGAGASPFGMSPGAGSMNNGGPGQTNQPQ